MERKGPIRKDMKTEIDYVKHINNTVLETQLDELKKYYSQNQIAPYFIKDSKFIPVENPKLYELQSEFEKSGGKWNFFNGRPEDGPA